MANYKNIKPYADFAHTAAQNGGVEKYLDQIAESNYALGVMDEKNTEVWKAAAVVTASLSLWEGGKWIYKKGKNYYMRRREEAARKSEAAKRAIIEGIAEAKAVGLVNEEENDE